MIHWVMSCICVYSIVSSDSGQEKKRHPVGAPKLTGAIEHNRAVCAAGTAEDHRVANETQLPIGGLQRQPGRRTALRLEDASQFICVRVGRENATSSPRCRCPSIRNVTSSPAARGFRIFATGISGPRLPVFHGSHSWQSFFSTDSTDTGPRRWDSWFVPVERAQVAGRLGGCSVEDVWMLSVCSVPDSRSARHAVQSGHRTVSKSASRTPGPVCRGRMRVCGDSGSRNPLS
jgi:hypothetical protein